MYMIDQLVLTLIDTINDAPDGGKSNDALELEKALLKYARKKNLRHE